MESMSFPPCFHDALLLVTHCNYSLVKVPTPGERPVQSAGPFVTASRRSCSERGAEVHTFGCVAVKGQQKRLGHSPQAFIWLKSGELAYPVMPSMCCILVLWPGGLLVSSPTRKVYYTKPYFDCQAI